MSEMQYFRFKHFLKERQEFSQTGTEELLSVSEYYGIAPRATVFDEDRKESRAESLEGYRIVKKGDFVMNYMLAWKGAYGVSEHDGIVSPAYSVFEVDESIVDLKYFHYRARSKDMQGLFKSVSRGIMESRLRLYPESLLSLPIHIPARDFQCRVSEYLDTRVDIIDTLIAKKTRFIELLKEKRQAVITKAVTKGLDDSVKMKDSGIEWIEKVPTHWNICALGYLAAVATGGTPDRQTASYWNGNIPWVKTGEINYLDITSAEESITTDGLQNSSAYIAQPGTILMAMYGMGVTRGRVAVLDIPASFNQACAGISCSSAVNNRFVYYSLAASYHYVRELANSASQANLSIEIIRKLKIPLPPMDEQLQIVQCLKSRLRRLEMLTKSTQRSIDLLKEKRSALITAAVTGKIDVREAA